MPDSNSSIFNQEMSSHLYQYLNNRDLLIENLYLLDLGGILKFEDEIEKIKSIMIKRKQGN